MVIYTSNNDIYTFLSACPIDLFTSICKECQYLTHLTLRCFITDAHMRCLSESLVGRQVLTHLDMSDVAYDGRWLPLYWSSLRRLRSLRAPPLLSAGWVARNEQMRQEKDLVTSWHSPPHSSAASTTPLDLKSLTVWRSIQPTTVCQLLTCQLIS